MDVFSTRLFDALSLRGARPAPWPDAHSAQRAFEQALKLCGYDADPLAAKLSFQEAEAAGDARAEEDATKALDHLRLRYAAEWPVSLVLTPSSLDGYNRVFLFFLRVKRVTHELKALWLLFKGFKLQDPVLSVVADEDGPPVLVRSRSARALQSRVPVELAQEHEQRIRELELVRHEMQHVVATLQGYLISQVLEQSWTDLQARLAEAESLAALAEQHALYMERALHRCFLSERTKSVMEIVNPIFRLIFEFRDSVRALELAEPVPREVRLRSPLSGERRRPSRARARADVGGDPGHGA
jgi:hypothetical protein